MAVSFESEALVGSLIVWDSGEYDLERIYIATDDLAGVPYYPYYPAATTDDLIAQISEELKQLGIG